MSQTKRKKTLEIVFGQHPNSLYRFEFRNGSDTINEEDLGNLLSDTPESDEDVSTLSSSPLVSAPVIIQSPSSPFKSSISIRLKPFTNI